MEMVNDAARETMLADSPLIDAVRARLLCEPGEDSYDALAVHEREKMQVSARAMLLAMRKPSDTMMQAGGSALDASGRLTSGIDAMLVWERMIDAAVSG